MSIAIMAGAAALIYAALCAFLYFKQGDLLFYRVTTDPVLARKWERQRVEISSADTIIEGWWRRDEGANTDLTLLYFGGNAEDVLYTAEAVVRIQARNVLVTNYRGYGRSQGVPSQQTLFSDALAIYDYASKQAGVNASKIVVMGRSLGSGVATYLAANRPVCGVLLITPYDSMVAVAATHYGFFPVRYLLKSPFQSDQYARKIHAPVLMIAAAQDAVVPPIHAQRLFSAWAGPKQIFTLEGMGHNDVDEHARYYLLMNQFLDELDKT